MATFQSIRIIPMEICSFDSSTLTTGFDELCDGLNYPAYLLRFTSLSNGNVEISFDATYSHEVLPAGDTLEIYGPHMSIGEFSKGQRVWIKGTAAKTGYIYMSSYTVRRD